VYVSPYFPLWERVSSAWWKVKRAFKNRLRKCIFRLLSSFQPPFSQKKYKVDERKKSIAMPSVNHHDVSTKPSQCFYQTIVKTLLYHHEDFFVPFRRRKKSIMMSSGKHYSVLEKAL
jgi:hypothetical protein